MDNTRVSKVACQNCGKMITVADGAYFGIICTTCSSKNNIITGKPLCPMDHKPCSYYGSKICTKDETCIGLVKED